MRTLAGFAELPGEVECLLVTGEAERVGVVLIDAFGWAFVERHLDHPLLRRCAREGLLAPMAAQFPPTTTAHVTTMHSGLPVGEHGLYEWRVFEPSAGRTIIPLTSSWADGGPPDALRSAGVPPERYVPRPSFYERLADRGIESVAIKPAAIRGSAYSGVALRCAARACRLTRASPTPRASSRPRSRRSAPRRATSPRPRGACPAA